VLSHNLKQLCEDKFERIDRIKERYFEKTLLSLVRSINKSFAVCLLDKELIKSF